MHSIRNILERNKIDTQSRGDAYIRRKRLISKSDCAAYIGIGGMRIENEPRH